MITVNLRPDLKRKRARRPITGALDGFRGLGSKIKDPVLLVAVLSWVGVLGWLAFVFVGTTRELSALTPQLEHSRAENRRFKAFLTEKRRGSVRKAMPVKSVVVVKALRRPDTSALPKVGSKKYFCATSQEKISRAKAGPGRHPC